MKNDKSSAPDISAKADDIFIRAMEIEPEEQRQGYIEEACGNDELLRREVDRLFSILPDSRKFFQKGSPSRITAVDIANTLTDIPGFFADAKETLPDDDEVGKQIGNYKLLQKIGEGGVGNVYLAEQSRPVRRQVALKIIKAGMDTKSVIARFEAERQALAMMEHPNIAHVLNAGETETGRPYFVMDLVHGERITTYCDENSLTVRNRLELFIQVCQAIQHAHQKGIIHRDIKPSNVLITEHDGEPHPVVIDFGIAKATSENLLTDKTVNTSMGPLIGTPAYMSPEQTNLKQVDIDTRSDIYSLGVLLYELLISSPPFDHNKLLKSGLDEMCRTLREEEPPSLLAKFQSMTVETQENVAQQRNTDVRRFPVALSDDLTWIAMKAMDKDRERRYESAGELAAEIQRFLNHEPVLARPPSRIYRLQKLVRRNKTTFAYLTVICLTVLAGLGTSTWLFFRERAARNREMKLLIEADARTRIAQAYLLITRNRPEEAERMMEEIEIPVIEPSLEATSVFRALAQWNVTLGRWKAAASAYRKLQQANQLDKSNTTAAMTQDLLGAGPALVVADEPEDYREFVRETLIRFIDTSDPSAAEQVIKNSLILPADETTLTQLVPFVKVVSHAVAADESTAALNSYYIGWRTLALSLYEYRIGNFHNAIYWGERSLEYADRNPPRVAMDHFVLAMACANLDRMDEARQELAAGQTLVENRLPNGVDRIVDLGSPEAGVWHDWVIAYLLLQEAESLIEGSSRSGP